MLEKLAKIVRLVSRKFPIVYKLMGNMYHKILFLLEDYQLRKKYPDVKHYKINKSDIYELQKGGFSSQYGQEKILLDNNYIPQLDGIFVDIGCNHPIKCSNTYALETHYGYRGLAIDPIKEFSDLWKNERPNSTFVNAFLSSNTKRIEFVEVAGKEGWENMLSGEINSVRIDGKDVNGKTRVIESLPLQDILDKYAFNSNIDVIFIDVEGYEQEVLNGIDWSRTKPNVIVVENVGKFSACNKLRDNLIKIGYKFTARVGISDDIFLLQGV